MNDSLKFLPPIVASVDQGGLQLLREACAELERTLHEDTIASRQYHAFMAEVELAALGRIEILRDGQPFATVSPIEATVQDVTPGVYEFVTDTGRLLWHAELSEDELLFGQLREELPMAADTGAETSTRQVSLLGGELNISVLRGLESGTITLKRGGNP